MNSASVTTGLSKTSQMKLLPLLFLASCCSAAKCLNPYEEVLVTAMNNTISRMEACALDPNSTDGVSCACRLYTITSIVREWRAGNMSLWQICYSQYLCTPGLDDFLFNCHNSDVTNTKILTFLEATLKSRDRL